MRCIHLGYAEVKFDELNNHILFDMIVHAMQWQDKLIKDPGKILLMLSGGKDSVYCLALLQDLGYEVDPIFFTHAWSWKNSHSEALRASQTFNKNLLKLDISEEFFKVVSENSCGRPCRFCKPIMYREVIDYALKNDYRYICVGDNASDTIVSRLEQYLKVEDERNIDLSVNGYLDCVEQGLPVPNKLTVIRPIIGLTAEEVEKSLLEEFNYKVQKNHETGDKYHGYWREGCPIQYTDPGFIHTKASLSFVLEANEKAVEYAKKKGFRASVHYPSGHIVTVPSGFEDEIYTHLKMSGIELPTRSFTKETPYIEHWVIEILDVPSYYLEKFERLEPLASRFAERLKVKVVGTQHKQFEPFGVSIVKILEESHLAFHSWPENNYLHIDLLSCEHLNLISEELKIVCSEVFKSKNIILNQIDYRNGKESYRKN